MSLETYKRKRDFGKTPEPAGEVGPTAPPAGDRRFVVQRHRATRLHYDFRLEIDGVLASWAVPKGPSLNPKDRRMAVHVEDHPLSYYDFEGVIPKGEYGGGDVIVWDWGTFAPEETDDPGKAVSKGELKFRLDGQKLRGRFTLVKTRSADPAEDNWLLIHKHDDAADPEWDVDDHPQSVKSGRTNDEVATGVPAIWDSHAPDAEAEIDLSAAQEEALPEFISPMKATAVDKAFSDADWLFELKLDGYRVEAVVHDGRVRLWTRNKQDAATYFPDLAAAAPSWIRAREAILDGEVVAVDDSGNPSFSLLQERAGPMRDRARRDAGELPPIIYYIFDLLHLDGRSLLDVPLEQRKRLLRSVLREHHMVRFATHVNEDGEAFLDAVRERRLEGMVAKLRSSPYEPGRRSRYWLKVKVRREQEVVVVGYEPGKGSHRDLGSLLVAVAEDGGFRFVGEVGSGLDDRTRRFFRGELEEHALDAPPVTNPPRIRGVRWAEPRHVVRVEFTDWTADDLLRQPAYKGIDTRRDPRAVRREKELPARRTVEGAEKSAASKSVASKAPSAKSAKIDGLPQAATPAELAALEEMTKDGNWEVGSQSVRVSNLDKVLFAESGFTKRDLIRYYVTVAPVMLPYLRGRPVNLSRWPDGIAGHSFWQKEIPKYAPDWMARWKYPDAKPRETHTYIVVDQVATMAWLANHATIDIHPWTSRTASHQQPDYALVDIDPGPETQWDEVIALTGVYRTAFEHLGVTAFPKVTGKRGIQVWVPVRAGYSYDDTRNWVEGLSRAVGATLPELVSWEWAKTARRGKARLDFTQNAVNKTLVAPYAVRPAEGAPVSAPITWQELDDPGLRPNRWNIRTILERLEQGGDLFAGALELEQDLPPLG
ncbi:DNA ligase D [soil metagenome]